MRVTSSSVHRVKSKADDLGVESRRCSEPKQTIFWAKTDDLTKADDRKKMFFFDLKQTILVKADDLISFIFYISKQTILMRKGEDDPRKKKIRIKADDLMVHVELRLECKLSDLDRLLSTLLESTVIEQTFSSEHPWWLP